MKWRVLEWNGVFKIERFEPGEDWQKVGEFDNYEDAITMVKDLKSGALDGLFSV